MKKILLLLFIVISAYSVELDYKWIKQNYAILTQEQKDKIIDIYAQGQLLVINGEAYGLTAATFAFVESSVGRFRIGDNGDSRGLVHMSYRRTKELLKNDPIYKGLLTLPKERLMYLLQINDHLNIHLALVNFKSHLKRWKSYSKAVRAHNGYDPKRGVHNLKYYNKFINAMQIVKLVIKERK